MNNFSADNMQILLKLAASKLGVREEELKNAVQSGNLSGLKNVDTKKISETLSNPEIKDKILSSPQAQEMLKNFSKK